MAKSANANSESDDEERLPIQKTYKLYIGGAFPRTESGRFYTPTGKGKANKNAGLGNICLSSRKDVRNAVVAARAAQSGWADKTAYNRAQILYRISEMMEGRAEQFVSELEQQGLTHKQAQVEIIASIDRLVYYAGWCDKYQQIFSCVNPVASSHFNFSMLEPTGVVFIIANEQSPLLGLVSLVGPVIAGGNSCVVLASESCPLSAITFAEVLHSSDVPGGVVNLLTGKLDELVEHFSKHLDVNAIACDRHSDELTKTLQENATSNLKRVRIYQDNWANEDSGNPYMIQDFCETKTTWHPIEKISASGSGY